MVTKKWTLTIEYVNCGSKYCKQGCFENGSRTKEKPHGAYSTLVRRSISGHTHVWRHFEKIRLGSWTPDDEAMKLLNSNENFTGKISYEDSTNRKTFYENFRRKFYLLLVTSGWDGDDIEALIPE